MSLSHMTTSQVIHTHSQIMLLTRHRTMPKPKKRHFTSSHTRVKHLQAPLPAGTRVFLGDATLFASLFLFFSSYRIDMMCVKDCRAFETSNPPVLDSYSYFIQMMKNFSPKRKKREKELSGVRHTNQVAGSVYIQVSISHTYVFNVR